MCSAFEIRGFFFRCDECMKCFHFTCLDPPVKKTPKRIGYSCHCADCDPTVSTQTSQEAALVLFIYSLLSMASLCTPFVTSQLPWKKINFKKLFWISIFHENDNRVVTVGTSIYQSIYYWLSKTSLRIDCTLSRQLYRTEVLHVQQGLRYDDSQFLLCVGVDGVTEYAEHFQG
jgi:hypothetical protein